MLANLFSLEKAMAATGSSAMVALNTKVWAMEITSDDGVDNSVLGPFKETAKDLEKIREAFDATIFVPEIVSDNYTETAWNLVAHADSQQAIGKYTLFTNSTCRRGLESLAQKRDARRGLC